FTVSVPQQPPQLLRLPICLPEKRPCSNLGLYPLTSWVLLFISGQQELDKVPQTISEWPLSLEEECDLDGLFAVNPQPSHNSRSFWGTDTGDGRQNKQLQ
ncbi:hypothetical protein STEG23_035463, partial [Scotinomys teguina]